MTWNPRHSTLLVALILLLASCGGSPAEGDQAGDCSDGVDNDGNGLTDCDDSSCLGSAECTGDDDDTGDDDTGDDDTGDDDTGDDDTAGDDDTGDDDTAGDDDSSGDDDSAGDDDSSGDDDDSVAPADADNDGWDELVDCDDNDAALNLDDSDSDGVDTCSGDCDDDPATGADNFPGNAEICDGGDNDCASGADFVTTDDDAGGETDSDTDGVLDCADCADSDATNYPGNVEVCDGQDNNCDGAVDENASDADGDSYGCDDCNDNEVTVNPGAAAELCDGFDTDCSSGTSAPEQADELDDDGDGYIECAGFAASGTAAGLAGGDDCLDDATNTYSSSVNPAAAEVCDGYDTDCSSGSSTPDDANETDDDGDGFVGCSPFVAAAAATGGLGLTGGGDCDDTATAVGTATNPGATEVCDAVDNNCDGATDEGFDADGDGFTTCGGDCNDGDGSINPNAAEICDGVDNNCVNGIDGADAAFDNDEDNDGFNDDQCGGNDCDDSDAAINQNATEVASNGVDDNCDGNIDEVTPFTFTEIWNQVVLPPGGGGCFCHASPPGSGQWNHGGSQSGLYAAWVGVNSTTLGAGMKRIQPNDSANSYVMHKLDGTHSSVGGFGSQMPASGCCLSQTTRDRIRAWIDSGAPNN